MSGVQNVFACLVHESQECVVDLVRNLRHADPSSVILLYNGGKDPGLLNHGFPFSRHGAVGHRAPRPLKWGWLHDFALNAQLKEIMSRRKIWASEEVILPSLVALRFATNRTPTQPNLKDANSISIEINIL